MLKSFKYRISPNKEQTNLLDKTFGCNRYIWNQMLNEKISVYEKLKDDKEKLYSYKYKTEKIYKEEFEWLKEVDSISLQQTRINLNEAFQNFFRGLKKKQNSGFPKFKSKKNKQSYRIINVNNNIKIDFEKKKIKLPKIGWIKYSDDRVFTSNIRSVSTSKNPTGEYFVSILFESNENLKNKKNVSEINKKNSIAMDMSCGNFVVSEDKQFTNHKFYRKSEAKISKLNRSFGRKTKNSNNRNKARIKLAKEYQKITNKKNDYLHKLSKELVDNYDAIFIENLNIDGMTKRNKPKQDENGNFLKNGQKSKSGRNKTIRNDLSWGKFVEFLTYKSEWYGTHLIKVDRFFPSSKLCSECGNKNDHLKLNDRKWICPKCNVLHDRDINASINIKKEGLRFLKENTVGATEINACRNMNIALANSAQESTFFRKW